MYELIQAGENTFYIDSPTKLGVYRIPQGAYLVDSGNSKDAGKRARQILDANGWPLLGVLNTHSHADHIGGNRFLQDLKAREKESKIEERGEERRQRERREGERVRGKRQTSKRDK